MEDNFTIAGLLAVFSLSLSALLASALRLSIALVDLVGVARGLAVSCLFDGTAIFFLPPIRNGSAFWLP